MRLTQVPLTTLPGLSPREWAGDLRHPSERQAGRNRDFTGVDNSVDAGRCPEPLNSIAPTPHCCGWSALGAHSCPCSKDMPSAPSAQQTPRPAPCPLGEGGFQTKDDLWGLLKLCRLMGQPGATLPGSFPCPVLLLSLP